MNTAPVLPRHLLDIRTILLEPEVEKHARGAKSWPAFPKPGASRLRRSGAFERGAWIRGVGALMPVPVWGHATRT